MNQDDGFSRALPDNEARCEALLAQAERCSSTLAKLLADARESAVAPPMRKARWRTLFIHPGGGMSRCVDLVAIATPAGACLLHAGYVHPSTRCTLHIPTHFGITDQIEAAVASCTHVSGNVHLCEVRFDTRYDLSRCIKGFVDHESREDDQPADPARITGRAMIIDDTPLDAHLLQAHLGATRLRPSLFDSLPRALDRLRRELYHIVVCDAHLEPASREGVISLLRNAGHRGPIVLLVGDPRSLRENDQAPGAMETLLAKPFSQEQVIASILSLMRKDNGADLPSTISSDLAEQTHLLPLIRDYVKAAKAHEQSIRRAMESEDFAAARAACQELRETGGSFGFSKISEAAQAAVVALDASMAIHESLRELDFVLEVLARIVEPDELGGPAAQEPAAINS